MSSLRDMFEAVKAAKFTKTERRVLTAEQLEKLRTRNRIVAAAVKGALKDTSWLKYIQVYDVSRDQAIVDGVTDYGFIVVPFCNVRVTLNDPAGTKLGFVVQRIFKAEHETEFVPSADNPEVKLERLHIMSTKKVAIRLFSPMVCERDGLPRSAVGYEKHLFNLMNELEELDSLEYLRMVFQYLVAMTEAEEKVLTDLNTLTPEECDKIFAEFIAASTTEQN